MKKLLVFLLLALPALSGSYTITTSAAQDAMLTRTMDRLNAQTCRYYGQAVGCTQVQARKEFCRRAGVGGITTCVPNANPALPPVCTTTPLVADCPGAPQVDVYSTVGVFLDRETVRLLKEEYGPKNDAEDAAAFVANPATATVAQKNAWCRVNGLAAGCLP